MDSRGKILSLHDRLYVSPYLLRPLRRLEEVERDAARRETGARRPAASANDDHRPPGGTPPGREK